MKNRDEVTTPAGDNRLIGALIAARGTIAMTCQSSAETSAPSRHRRAELSVTLARFVPVIVTIEPRNPLSGTNAVIAGRAIVGDGEGVAGVGSTIGIVGSGRLGGGRKN